MECSINSPALSLLLKHLVIGQHQKAPNFSAFHWKTHGSLVSIGQHFVATRVVHLPKRTEISLITESDQSGPNHQLLQLCTASTAWSDSDQAVQAVHSCNSWFGDIISSVKTLLSQSVSVLANRLLRALLKASPDNIPASTIQQLLLHCHRRRKRGGQGGQAPPIIWEGGQHTLWPP